MEGALQFTILITFFSIIFTKLLIHIRRKQHKNKNLNLPPSPPSLPIIGHIHLLKQPIHHTLNNLSQKYGPVISLRLGTRLAIVVSSPSAVEECFTKNDVVFANRPPFTMGKYVAYNNTVLSSANYGDHWRNLRRICTVEILSSNGLNKFVNVRKDEVNRLLRRLHQVSSHGFAKVELKSMFFDLTTNIIMRMVAGNRYCDEDAKERIEERKEFKEIIEEFFRIAEITNPGDWFPILQRIDYGGSIKRMVRLGERLDSFLQGLIDEHRMDKDRNTMINHLLSLQEFQPDYYSDEIIKGLILVIFVAGVETSATALEWAMANLLNNPIVLHNVKAELDNIIGQDLLIDESDLPKLNYTQSVIYENSRLSTVSPLLIPHMSLNDCTIGGFHVPANTLLFVNVWAIHGDPNFWDDPTSFKPERFENGKSQGFKYLPFGFGRRACPGEALANKVMGLTLCSLIQCFDWEKVGGKQIDMSERIGTALSKLEPLEIMCKARPILDKVLF